MTSITWHLYRTRLGKPAVKHAECQAADLNAAVTQFAYQTGQHHASIARSLATAKAQGLMFYVQSAASAAVEGK